MDVSERNRELAEERRTTASLLALGPTADAICAADVDAYDAVFLGGSLCMGRWHADARAFLRRHRAALEERALAVFALGPLTLEEGQVAGSRRHLDKTLTRLNVHPHFVTGFGGAVEPEKLHFPFNRMPQTDARDWAEIEAWTSEVAGQFADYLQPERV
jgi:menaquinone-dependent protoporphyrinogen oxidase